MLVVRRLRVIHLLPPFLVIHDISHPNSDGSSIEVGGNFILKTYTVTNVDKVALRVSTNQPGHLVSAKSEGARLDFLGPLDHFGFVQRLVYNLKPTLRLGPELLQVSFGWHILPVEIDLGG